MSKRVKGVALDPSPGFFSEDARAVRKHQSLLQDYQELQKDTIATRNKLRRAEQKKLTLLAEVQFLMRRYNYLLKNQAPKPPIVQIAQPQNLRTEHKSSAKERNHSRKQVAFLQPVPHFDFKKKEKSRGSKETVLLSPGVAGKDAVLQNSSPVLDLNQKERISCEKEAAQRNPIPVFDLNQISVEEEESLANPELIRMEEPRNLIRSVDNEQFVDMKLSACRNIGNGSGRAGKRKISWQDPVALRV